MFNLYQYYSSCDNQHSTTNNELLRLFCLRRNWQLTISPAKAYYFLLIYYVLCCIGSFTGSVKKLLFVTRQLN